MQLNNEATTAMQNLLNQQQQKMIWWFRLHNFSVSSWIIVQLEQIG